MKGIDLAEGYETFVPPTKAIDEPYSATGDLDEDDVTNLEEYQNIQLLSGTPEDFANSANDPTNDGTMLPGGEGEGEGPSPICGALWIDGVPFSGGVGDLALLTLVVGALLLAQGRRRSRVQK
jgi:hypothetical protein